MTVALAKKKEPALIRYDQMCQAINRASAVDEAKEYRDQAVALAAYYKQALNRDNERKCCEIRIRAERRAGELLAEQAKNGTRQKRGGTGRNQSQTSRRSTSAPTLSDYGISKDQSSDWQKLAAIPKAKFEEELRKPGMPTTSQILEAACPSKRPDPLAGVDADALKVWGLLRDFTQLLGRDVNELILTMTKPMRREVSDLAPQVSCWLSTIP